MKFCYVNENNILLFTIYSVYTCITNFNEQYFFDDYALVSGYALNFLRL